MRRLIVAFAAAIAAVVVLNGRAAGSVAGASATIHLSEAAHASGIDFVHQDPHSIRKSSTSRRTLPPSAPVFQSPT